ncbi:glycoside hydrolase family 130 protein [Sphingobacterium chuzhouense]|uniref:Glycosylase n=1 Tax=Sphingobacterium chuzhouense TaxID=1742264 RepID=A0ABR7XPT8_9SPHI|nr:glycosylase [Sphingobacterium chuzhouense]MBD1420529.1 glycosylase [Sphingobacterium chuzhouense]
MKRIGALFFMVWVANMGLAQPTAVSEFEMEQLYQEVKTPYKYGLVLTPQQKGDLMDCPSVYRDGKKWYMTYIVFDGEGYETWLAESTNLLEWKVLGKQMSKEEGDKWDSKQRAGYNALIDIKWGGNYKLHTYDGKYWMSYFGGASVGYEPEPLAIGMAYTAEKPVKPMEWQRLDKPVLTSKDEDVRWWENRHKLFKSYVVEDKKRNTGHRFIMYYNAVGDSLENNKPTRWYERIGMAVSDDMKTWKRYLQEPVVHHPVGITGDPMIQRINNTWVMFYFGAFWKDREGAFNRFAASKDLIHWTDWQGDNLIDSSEDFDSQYAHKSFVIKYKGVVYHYYCAVDKAGNRGIALATSKDKGKSKLKFELK